MCPSYCFSIILIILLLLHSANFHKKETKRFFCVPFNGSFFVAQYDAYLKVSLLSYALT